MTSMKKIFRFLPRVFAVAALLTATSCLEFDDPGDESQMGDIELDDEVFHGNADKIDYRYVPTQEGFDEAKQALHNYMGQMISAEYAMRGGKENGFPEAHAYQYQFSLGVDNYSGYFTAPQDFDGRLKSTLYVYDSFNSGPNGSYLIVKNALVPLLNHPKADSIPELKAMALLLLDYSSQEVTDIYGPMPLEDYKANKLENPFTYNTMRDIYYNIVDNLDSINACLKHFDEKPEWYQTAFLNIMTNSPCFDWITKNFSIDSWRQLGNSLKLRMAMHIAYVEPETAQRWAEEAVAAGVVDNLDGETGLFPTLFGFNNPISTISSSWNDTRLNASFESILKSLGHPYADYLWDKNSDPLVDDNDPSHILPADSMVVGLRAGIRMMSTQVYDTNPRCAYSRVNKDIINDAPLYLMKLSEVDFLRAEGALRGWNMGGTAEEFYNRGIRYAWLEDRDAGAPDYQAAMADYMNRAEAIPFTYRDPMNARYDAESLTHVGVKWNDADDFETKLEKIITQKYIAGFPYSFEAWVDLRRTGYPRTFPILNVRDGDRSLSFGQMIRRMPFPGTTDNNTAADVAATGLEALGGPDTQATHLWWDVKE